MLMIFRIRLPREDDPYGDLDSDTANGSDAYKANKEPQHAHPSDCVGCMPLVNMDITAAVITAFFK